LILAKDQINRYMRHIAMPEISGSGQKKLLDSSVVLFCENLRNASLALYYLVASGIGSIYCSVSDSSGWDRLSRSLSDLNSDAKAQLLDKEGMEGLDERPSTVIINGSLNFAGKTLRDICKDGSINISTPIVISLHDGWKGLVRTLASHADVQEFLTEIDALAATSSDSPTFDFSNSLSSYFASLIAVIEHIKQALSLGKPISRALYFDLFNMNFDFIPDLADAFDKLLSLDKRADSFAIPDCSRVLITGCGGLGSPAAFALAASGAVELGLVDFDSVELSNLNRQIMHSSSRIGMPKVQSAELFLRQINPNLGLELLNVRISKGNVQNIISSYDVIIGGFDNLPSRYVLNDACYAAGKPWIEGGALDISGLATTIIPGEGHCYRCIFPETEDNVLVPSCSETGVLGPVPGIVGVVQAAEALKLLAGTGEPLKNRILFFDVFDTDIYIADHGKNRYCDLCGKQ